jgi:hypothetical protein
MFSEFVLLDASEIKASLPQQYFDLTKRSAAYKGKERERDTYRELLKELAQSIARKVAVGDWSRDFVSRFVLMACAFGRSAVLDARAKPGVTDAERAVLIKYADWTCSVAANSQADGQARVRACGLWAMAQLTDRHVDNPEQLLLRGAAGLAPVMAGVEGDGLADQLKAQLVITIASRIDHYQPGDAALDVARRWCSQLLTVPEVRRLIIGTRSASSLGVEIPVLVSPAVPQPMQEEVIPAAIEAPQLWPVPPLLDAENVKSELEHCLIELAALSEPTLSRKTSEAILELTPDSSHAEFGRLFYVAGRELWRSYWSQGDSFALVLAERLSVFLLGASPSADERDRSNTLHLWMNTQLPLLIRTCDLDELVDDSERLSRFINAGPSHLRVLQAIIEAHAGYLRSSASGNESVDVLTFLNERRDELKRIHEQYRRAAGVNASEEELHAWDAMFPTEAPAVSAEAVSSVVNEPAAPAQDNALRDVVRHGRHEGTLLYIKDHEEALRARLADRLKAKLSPDHLMYPEGSVYTPGRTKQLNPRFADGVEALKSGDFQKASTLFQKLVAQLPDRPRDIARSYEAFALAKNGDLLAARMALQPLTKAAFSYPSAHWNLACCVQPEQMDQRLEILAAALKHAPHMRILHGSVSLALILEDQRLREWLPLLPITEALLLAYSLNYDELDATARDQALFRLKLYIDKGEPTVPEPTASLSLGDVNGVAKTLLERRQVEAIEFWFRCREPMARRRYDYWQAKGDYYSDVGRKGDALDAFRQELQCRLSLFKPGATAPSYVISTIRKRSEERLLQCMVPQFREIGQDIYNRLVEADKVLKMSLVPRSRRLQEYYGHDEEEKPDEPINVPDLRGGLAALDTVLARAGAESHAQLHDIASLPQVRDTIQELIRTLPHVGADAAAQALAKLLDSWNKYAGLTSKEEQVAAIGTAHNLLAEVQGRFQSDLKGPQRLLASQLLEALVRVDRRLASSFKLLPHFAFDAVDGRELTIDPSAVTASFAIRIRCSQEDVAVQLQSAVAIIPGSVMEFPLKDKLDQVPTFVSPGQDAVLTFAYPGGGTLNTTQELRVELRYACGNGTFDSSGVLPLKFQASSRPPALTPYIYGRRLEPSEIDGHFFGRESEQEAILDSVRAGQQKIRYIEGIRRAGKSSLLSSITHEIAKRGLPLIPVYWAPVGAGAVDHVGKIFHDLLSRIARAEEVSAAGVVLPDLDECCANLPGAYSKAEDELRRKCPNKVLVMVDDFQTLVEAAHAARDANKDLRAGILGFLNLLYERANPSAQVLWILAGQRAFRQYRTLLGGALMWGIVKPLPVDFLPVDAVAKIVISPLGTSGYVVPPETISRVHLHTAGHPEVVQELAESMLEVATADRRYVVTPSDADDASRDIAAHSDGFSETWYPLGDLSPEQRALVASFVNAVGVGGRAQPHLLVKDKELTEAHRLAIDDLVARKILVSHPDGSISIKARILDAWLHRVIPTMITDRMNGSVAIFVDVANLTAGTGASVVSELQTSSGDDGIAGRFRLATILDRIEAYAKTVSAAPRGPRWAVNFPKASPAVTECNAKDYSIENVPKDLWEKGDDDRILIEKITDIERGYPTVNHFVMVLGDKGYRIKAESLLRNGKSVHIISPSKALAGRYDRLAEEYPEQMRVFTLEELIEPPRSKG